MTYVKPSSTTYFMDSEFLCLRSGTGFALRDDALQSCLFSKMDRNAFTANNYSIKNKFIFWLLGNLLKKKKNPSGWFADVSALRLIVEPQHSAVPGLELLFGVFSHGEMELKVDKRSVILWLELEQPLNDPHPPIPDQSSAVWSLWPASCRPQTSGPH